jgi:predicted Zn-dependent peptidase
VAAPQESYLDELERLAELRDRGIISEEDFEAKKRQLLGL